MEGKASSKGDTALQDFLLVTLRCAVYDLHRATSIQKLTLLL